ncbi:MAG TPA: hypothetical protein ENJ60_06455 [Aeromonadales bacterium]|nr:hypothetical protein [Aeromonadales bacterium]
MKKIILIALILIPAINYASERKVKIKYLSSIERDERVGVRYYKRGEYKKAFKILSESAQWGMKQPQYLMAIMYLKGQYVKQSIATGMAWLGVATEIDIEDWKKTFDGIYNKLNEKQQAYIDKKVALYIQLYGMKTHNLACNKRQALDSRKVRIHCELRVDRVSPRYELENDPEK